MQVSRLRGAALKSACEAMRQNVAFAEAAALALKLAQAQGAFEDLSPLLGGSPPENIGILGNARCRVYPAPEFFEFERGWGHDGRYLEQTYHTGGELDK